MDEKELRSRFLEALKSLEAKKIQESQADKIDSIQRTGKPKRFRRLRRRPVEPLQESSGPQHEYMPRGAATELMKFRGSQIILSGPAGTGKSRACLEKINLLNLLNPGARTLVVRKTLASLSSTGLVTWREKVVKEGLENGVLWFYGGSSEEPAQYKYKNGSALVVGGMDKATKIMSSEYDAIYVQEATELTENDWEMLDTRLRNGRISFQQLMADCNPDRPTHWLKQRADRGASKMLSSEHKDNPVLYSDSGEVTEFGSSYIEKLQNLSGVRKLRLYNGIWAAADGLVYSEFDPGIHLVDRFPIPESWDRYWTVDFGYTNPFVCQFWAEDPDGRLFMYREVYFTRRTVARHAETIAKIVMENPVQKGPGEPWVGRWREPMPRDVICDHDAEGKDVFEHEMGLGTKNAHKAVSDGVQAVQERLQPAGDGKPRLYIMRDSLAELDTELSETKKPTSTEDEITGYVWDDKGKDAPLKKDDHGMDAMRYLVADIDLVGRPRYRSFPR